MNGLNDQPEYEELVEALKHVPGGESLVQSVEDTDGQTGNPETVPAPPSSSSASVEDTTSTETDSDEE